MILDQRGLFAEQPVEPAEGVRRERAAAQQCRDGRRNQNRPDRPGGLPLRFLDFPIVLLKIRAPSPSCIGGSGISCSGA